MSGTMPSSWESVNLGDVAEFEMGQAPPSSTCNTAGHGTVFVKAGEFGAQRPIVREWTTAPLKRARESDVLICVVGATAGKLNLGIDCAIGRSVAAIRPFDPALQRTIYRQLQLQVEGLRRASTGSAQGVISKEMLSQVRLRLPAAREQQRIADKLDTVLARVDACRDRLSRVAPLLKRFRQSVLSAAASGMLLSDSKTAPFQLGEETLLVPAHWQRKTLRDLIQPERPLCYGVVQPGPDKQGGVPLIRVQDIDRGQIMQADLRTVSQEVDKEFSRSRVQQGDILISIVGTIGRTAIVPTALEANIARAIARISPAAGCSSAWLHCWLNTAPVQWWLTSSSKEVARKTLNLSDLARLPVALPPAQEQAEIVRRVETLFAFADRLEARLATAQAAADRLTPALLAKAFRGELVPQDPNDEPATELLARLAAQREAQPRAAKRRGAALSAP